MQLDLREASRLLNLPEKTVQRWVRQGKLPATRINEQLRFNRAELLQWATEQQLPVSPELFQDEDAAPAVSLAGALSSGGIHVEVPAADKPAALEAVVARMPLAEEVDRPFLLQLLLARESLASTGVGGGIAVPHVRNPIVMHVPRAMITLCFLERPIEFGALDGKPVQTLFTIVSPTIRAHLDLLGRLTFGLRQPAFLSAVSERNAEAILREADAVDRNVRHSAQGP